jgi:hypothetical protein
MINMKPPTNLLVLLTAILPPETLSKAIVSSTGGGGIATGFTRDSDTGDLLVVGTTYTDDSFWGMEDVVSKNTAVTSCFVANGNVKDEEFKKKTFALPEMCYGGAVVLPSKGYLGSVAVVLGTSNNNSNIVTMYDYDHLEEQFSLPKTQFPIAITHDENDKVIMAHYEYESKAIFMEDELSGPKVRMEELLKYWDRVTVPGQMKSSQIRLKKMSARTGRVYFDNLIKTHDGQSTVSDMIRIKHDGRFVIAGSTNGSGNPFGAYPETKSDWDGYIAIFDSTTGELIFGGQNHRFASMDGEDDFVHGVCSHREDLYIVGSTRGTMEGNKKGGAFVAKMDLSTRIIEWKRQLSHNGNDSEEIIYDGVTCTSHHHHGVVIGGNALKTLPRTDKVKRDVFISRYDEDGNEMYLRHLDSSRGTRRDTDDFLVGLDLTKDGTDLTALLNSRDSENGQNNIVLVDIEIHNGSNDLSEFEEIAIIIPPHGSIKSADVSASVDVLGWIMLIAGLGMTVFSLVVYQRRKRERRRRMRMKADRDYDSNLKKWMDDDEIFDYNKSGLMEPKSGAAGLVKANKVNIRGNHISFNHDVGGGDDNDDFTMAYKQRVFQKNYSAQVEDYKPSRQIL